MARILLLGATGYVGGRLAPRLIERGHAVRCLARDPRKLLGKTWAANAEILAGDLGDPESLRRACTGVEIVIYLVHAMSAGEGSFASLDRRFAQNLIAAADRSNVRRVVYLGALGKKESDQSRHLGSRHEVADILRSGKAKLTEFRAAVVIGSGSASFEMIHHLVNRLPVMICPRWVYTRTQPIAISDVLSYLVESVENEAGSGRSFDIGSPQVYSYRDMMLAVARALGLRRLLLQVPVLTPRLSSYWVNLVTPIPTGMARALIEGLKHETVCEESSALEVFRVRPLTLEQAIKRALSRVIDHNIETVWSGATTMPLTEVVDPSHLRRNRQEVRVAAAAKNLFDVVAAIGGEQGWYYANWLWRLRGFIDKQLGGVGLRRGRRHPRELAVGEALDFWRVDEYDEGRRLTLRAEMKVWGQAWLEFEVTPADGTESVLVQTARYYPRGLVGLLYWYAVYPLHAVVFRGMVRAIAQQAEESEQADE